MQRPIECKKPKQKAFSDLIISWLNFIESFRFIAHWLKPDGGRVLLNSTAMAELIRLFLFGQYVTAANSHFVQQLFYKKPNFYSGVWCFLLALHLVGSE